MKINNRMRLLVVGASLAMIVIVAMPSKNSEAAPHPELPTPSGSHFVGRAPLDVVGSDRFAAQRERAAQLVWGRDPFSAPRVGPAPAGQPTKPARTIVRAPATDLPQLSGLCTIGDKSMAIIDHEIVQSGDRLATGYLIEEITNGTVRLSRGEKTLTLILGDYR